jgi:hypothetical protein
VRLAWNDDWLLASENDVTYAGRVFSRRTVHSGRPVASMARESWIADSGPPP